MRLKIAPISLECSQQFLPQSFTSPKPNSPFASSSFLSKCTQKNRTILCRFVVSCTWASTKLLKSISYNKSISRGNTTKLACGVNFDEFFHEDLPEQMCELLPSIDPSEDEEDHEKYKASLLPSKFVSLEPFMLGIEPNPPEWPEREEVIRASIERRANSFDIPVSLRMIKKKQQWQEGFGSLGDSACCSVKKAFHSMVFIILEIQSHALKMREVIPYEDFEGIIARVHREMHASFAWLFQQVFSPTPSLMISVMILLADFSIYSITHNTAIQDHSLVEATENVSVTERTNHHHFNSSAMMSFSCENSGGGDTYSDSSSHSAQFLDSVQNDISRFNSNEDDNIGENDEGLWDPVVDEAIGIQGESRGEVLDPNTMQSFVSPFSVELEPDDYTEYYRTDLLYQMGLSQDPNNSLLLLNYAQYLRLVAHDYDRAEECFKRAIQVEPPDAEALSHYANFLWKVRKDLWGAEERYLQAVAAAPENTYHVSKYANFLWSTGGEETCFPLN